ncbi:uncharacterized protein Gasu_59340 [Galdieria sulphuraria]|uniref:Uncharacterized protein n=1 Tax=Galdieria sulphuraria TaxID=130081 RepID=M2X9E8_GALSU|nr:uncharacterized protein Gasu_59340 [Galdieria sulphuraria]EME26447.1 hypothetical protein Gasu_59340 [Galdieria sulphuraria]|eukprot:XP_005702967.1 hypothetical protein Gasu_59340 [Galdieria sulphuraria]
MGKGDPISYALINFTYYQHTGRNIRRSFLDPSRYCAVDRMLIRFSQADRLTRFYSIYIPLVHHFASIFQVVLRFG